MIQTALYSGLVLILDIKLTMGKGKQGEELSMSMSRMSVEDLKEIDCRCHVETNEDVRN
jgi:hypothetical protein